MKKVVFRNLLEEAFDDICEGLLYNNGDCICLCCGSVFPSDERGESWEVVKVIGEGK